jgi:hypothetical protein
MIKDGKKVSVGFSEASAGSPATLSLTVAQGTPRAEALALIERLLKRPEIERLRPRGCQSCISGLDLRIRERFEQILEVEV